VLVPATLPGRAQRALAARIESSQDRRQLMFRCLCTLFWFLAAGAAAAQSHDPVALHPHSGEEPAARFHWVDEAPLEQPLHPPIDTIPAMPMPDSWDWRSDPYVRDTALFHDAERGHTEEWAFRGRTGSAGHGSSGDEYRGVDAVDFEPDVRAFGNMVVATGLTQWPQRANVKLLMRFTDSAGGTRWFVCSGSMADAGVVQTAAHCVYARNPNGIDIFDWAEEVYIYPAWDGVSSGTPPASTEVIQNYGFARGTSYLAGTAYINDGNFDRDAGLVRINRGSSRMVGLLTGWYGWTWGFDCAYAQARTYTNFSYPAEACGGGLHTGRTMYSWSGTFDSCPGNQLQINTSGGCLNAGWGGMSGSAAYWTENGSHRVHAVSSNSNRSSLARYAKFWEQWITDRTAFVNATRGTVLDLEALAFRTVGPVQVAAGNRMAQASSVLITNATDADPPTADYTLRIYLSTNSLISSADTLLATWHYNADFSAMQVRSFQVPAPLIPSNVPPGTYWLGAILDPSTDGVTANNSSSVWDALQITVLRQTIFLHGFE
jgi:hypothetical protein